MTCDRCFKALSDGDHGEGVCPYEARSAGRAFITDELPGGARMFENLGHEPVYIDSKSKLRQECAARGVRPFVRHKGVPGTDKSPQTTRWT
jgi:hypothetical protein